MKTCSFTSLPTFFGNTGKISFRTLKNCCLTRCKRNVFCTLFHCWELYSVKKGVLKNSAIFTGKHQCCLFFNKVADLEACNFIKKRLQHRCFPVNIAKFLRAPILKNTCQRLLLPIHFSGRIWSTHVHCMNLSATHLSSLIYTGSVVYN